MRAMVKLSLAAGLMVLALPRPAAACEYEFDPPALTGTSGQQLAVKATIIWTHRNCELDPQDVHVDVSGATLVGQPVWQQVKRLTWEATITVKLGAPGSGTLRVWRQCQRQGTHGKTLPITIKAG